MAAARRPVWRTLYFWVLVAIALGILTGALAPALGQSLKPLGDGFVKLVKMIITPVIFLTVVTGIAGMADLKAFGRVGLKALGYFLAVSRAFGPARHFQHPRQARRTVSCLSAGDGRGGRDPNLREEGICDVKAFVGQA